MEKLEELAFIVVIGTWMASTTGTSSVAARASMNRRSNNMKFNYLFLILFAFAVVWPSTLLGQPQQATNDTQAPLLTLDDAVSTALENNRLVKNSSLEARKFDFRVDTARSRRLPQFQFSVLGGELLQPFNFTIPAGTFGTYASTGPVPATNSKIHTPAQFVTSQLRPSMNPYRSSTRFTLASVQPNLHATSRAKMFARSVRRSPPRSETRTSISSRHRRGWMQRARL